MLFDFFKKFPFGLDISDFSIEALELKKKFGKICLGAYGRVELEQGIIGDGKILNKEKLKEKIMELLQNTVPRRLKTNQVILSLPESKTFFHIFKLPTNLSGKELYSAVEGEVLKTIPLDPNSLHFDFQVVSKAKNVQEVLCVGTSREIVDEYLEVLRGVGLKPLALDIESASLARAFKTEMIKDEGVIIADIGARTTILTIVDAGIIRLSATVPIAGNHWARAISEKLSISLEKAEELKRNCGLDPEKEEGSVMFVLQGLFQDILDEIKRSISFYEEKSGRKIKKILPCGGSSPIPKLASYFSSNLGIETKLADPWKNIKTKVDIIDHTGLHPVLFSNVIGLAKRGLEKNPEKAGINLIPVEKRPKPTFIGRRLSKSKIFSLLIVGLAIAAFAFLSWIIYTYILKALTPAKIPPAEAPLIEEELAAEEITPVEEAVPEEEELLPEKIPTVIIGETETGWLRVREKPGTIYPEIVKVYPGESYPLLEETTGWYKIEFEDGRQGWVSAMYTSKQ